MSEQAVPEQRGSIWGNPTDVVNCIQNLINGCMHAQSKGAYTLEESSILWNSITFIIQKQRELREQANPGSPANDRSALESYVHGALSEPDVQN